MFFTKMKFVPVILIVIYIQIRATTQEDTKKSDGKKAISIGLVSKEWRPKLLRNPKPSDNDILDKYKGTTTEAEYLFDKYKDPFRESHRVLLEGAASLLDEQYGYDPDKESIFNFQISDGTNNGADLQNVVMAMAMRNMLKFYNVFSIDLQDYSGTITKTIFMNAIGVKTTNEVIAKRITDFFVLAKKENKIIHMEKIHFIGHGWLGQLAGNIARDLKKTYNTKIKSILALDPHSLGISRLGDTLTADDAEVVHAYHTSMLLGTMSRKSVDIIFNDGFWQPGCKIHDLFCSHHRALQILPYVIAYPFRFIARECRSWLAFKVCHCNTNENTIELSFPPASNAIGGYYLRTFANYPYGEVDAGSVCVK